MTDNQKDKEKREAEDQQTRALVVMDCEILSRQRLKHSKRAENEKDSSKRGTIMRYMHAHRNHAKQIEGTRNKRKDSVCAGKY